MKAIFTLFVLVALFADLNKATTKDILQKVREECKEMAEVKDEILGNVRHNGMVNKESDESLKKYAKCVSVKVGFFGEDGVIEKDSVVKYFTGLGFNAKTTMEIFETCDGKDKPDDILLLAVHYNNCFNQYLPKHARILVE